MEDSNSSKTKIITVTYFINNDSEEKKLSIEIEKDINFLSYELITNKFFIALKNLITKETEEDNPQFNDIYLSELQNDNITFDYIRYLENNCWIFLGPKDLISLMDINNPELMIKVTIITQEKIKIKEMYDKTAEKINKIRNEIEDLSKEQYKINKNDICKNNNMDLVVLTSNPLMDGEKELRTMNDFNKIPSSIHEAIRDSVNLLNVEFSPLTKKKFIEVLSNAEYKPSILHLIFKSTYKLPENNEIPEGNSSKDYVNMVFEKEDYNLEFIDKDSLRDIIQKNENIKKNIKDINLIISTQLAEDIFKMFQEFEFKNIFVQHTTLTDIDYISKFNFIFYTDLVSSESQYIQYLFQDGLNSYNLEYGNIFCCCFHSHEKINGKNCEFMINLINEFYNDKDSIEDNKIDDIYMYKTIPHFCHLRINQHDTRYYNFDKDFCIIDKRFYKNNYEKKRKNLEEHGSNIILCCCPKKDYIYYECKKEYKDEDTGQTYKIGHIITNKQYNSLTAHQKYWVSGIKSLDHNINRIFFIKFLDEKENYLLGFGGKKKSNRKNYIPDFSKMNLLVGNNKLVYEVIKYIKEKDKFNIIIFPDSTNSNLNELANIIIEYIKERTEEYEAEDDELKIKKNISSKLNPELKIDSEQLNLIHTKSVPIYNIKDKEKDYYLLFDMNTRDCDIFADFDFWKKQNSVYFIIINDNIQTKILNEWKAKINKMVIFSLNKFEENQIKFDLEIKIKSLNKCNKYVKGQLKEFENVFLKIKH